MKLLKWVTMVAIVATTLFVTSCKKDSTPSKPDGFGLQGYWSTAAIGGKSFNFDAMPSQNYTYSSGTLDVYGTYTYSPSTDKLTLQHNMPGAPLETYDVVWKDDTFKTFNLVATGTTPNDKNGTYTFSVKQ